jgi:hypothetical protein
MPASKLKGKFKKMKKRIFAIIFAIGLSVSINASEASAQSGDFRVDVPFAFTASNKTLPAGTYIVGPANDSRNIWRLRNVNDKPDIFLLVGSLSTPDKDGDAKLTFRRYGERNFLAGFRSFAYQVALPTSSDEKSFRRNRDNVSLTEPKIVEAVAAKF